MQPHRQFLKAIAIIDWLQFFIWGAYVTSFLGAMATGSAALYFRHRLPQARVAVGSPAAFQEAGVKA